MSDFPDTEILLAKLGLQLLEPADRSPAVLPSPASPIGSDGAREAPSPRVTPRSMGVDDMEVSKNGEFCIYNKELCI